MSDQSKSKLWLPLGLTALLVLVLGYIFIDSGNGAESETPAAIQQNEEARPVSESGGGDSQFPEAPDFALNNLDGIEERLSDYRGQVVFVNFWATWCGPCRMEMPYFVDLVNEYGNQGFVVLGIALDPREFERVPAFVDQMDINYPIMLDKKGVSQLYGGIQSIPTTFVVNKEGKVVSRIVGSRPKAEFERIIQTWL